MCQSESTRTSNSQVGIMRKNILLVLPFAIGLFLMIYSWFLTYPLNVSSTNDVVFNHVSIYYWISLPFLLTSMFAAALTVKNNFLRWILSIGIVLTFYSLAYFYYTMPTPDSQSFRGMNEYFFQTKSLDASQLNHFYYQWPAYFILADVVTSVSGLSLASYEFLLYAIIAFLLATVLYLYGTKKFANGGIIVVATFFFSINGFLNYQSVPFSVALSLLFLLFLLGTREKSNTLVIAMIVLFSAILLTHLFVPVFLILYFLARSIFDKNGGDKRLYRNLFLITLVGYFLVQFTLARFSFDQIVLDLTKPPIESLSYLTSYSLSSAFSNPIYNTSQLFTRSVTILFVGLCAAGFIFLFIKRNLNSLDKAILFAGAIYAGLGVVLNTLGWRAGAIAFVPISLGAAVLFQGKFRKLFTVIFLVSIVLVLFVPLHNSFNTDIEFQTKESYLLDNFFIDHYSWTNPGFVVADFRTATYLTPKLTDYVYFQDWLTADQKADAVLYTTQMVGSGLGNYSSMESLSQGQGLNILYNDGISQVLVKPNSGG